MTQHSSTRPAEVDQGIRLRDLAAEWSSVDAWGAGTSLTGDEAARALLATTDADNTEATSAVAPVPAATRNTDDVSAVHLAEITQNHAPDFDGDGDAGWIVCTCGATFPSGIPGDLADWWTHFKAQLLGLCIACGSNDPDGPTDSNGDHWCDACRDAAVSG